MSVRFLGVLAPLMVVLVFPATLAHTVESATISEEELVLRAQQLMDAVAIGDKTPWRAYLADDVIFVDETGKKMDKHAALGSLQRLPDGYTGSIKIARPMSRFAPATAVLSYDCDETETIFGQEQRARYHSTDTWLYRNAHWQIVAMQVLRYYEDPAAAQIPATSFDDYQGTYSVAPGHTIRVWRQGDELMAQRSDGKAYALLPESADLFFRKGIEGRYLFHRDASRHVDALIDRRNNEDVRWKRIAAPAS